jgi:hypothetical protein
VAVLLALFALLSSQAPPAEAQGVANALHPGLERIVADTNDELTHWDRRVAQMIAAQALTLVEERRVEDRHDQWYRQEANGVPVLGAEVWRRQEGGRTTGLGGTVFRDVSVPPRPVLSPEEASLRVAAPDGAGPSLPPELVVLPLADGTFALAYRVRLFAGGTLSVYYVDAVTGKTLAIETAPGPSGQPPDPPAGGRS